MPYNRVSPFGVQHDLVSPGEEFRARNQSQAMQHHMQQLAMKAQMDALRGGGGAEMLPSDTFQRDPNEGRDMENVAMNAFMNNQQREQNFAQGMQGDQLKNRLDVTGLQMGPRNAEVEQQGKQWDQLAPQRQADLEGTQSRNFGEKFKMDLLKRAMPGAASPAGQGSGFTDPAAFGPMGMMAPGGASGAPSGDAAQAERMLQILGGQNPDANAAQREMLRMQVDNAKAVNPSNVAQQQYGQIAPLVEKNIKDVYDFIRSNNWSIAGNKDQLQNLFNSVMTRLQGLKASPDAMKLIQEDIKSAMRKALQENGVFFDSAGSDSVRQEYGL